MTTKKKLPFVIVRTYSAGVHCGKLVSRKGKEVTLADARRIWSWQGANSLHEIALAGVRKGSKISDMVESILLTETIEIISATSVSEKNLNSIGWNQ